MGACVFVQRNMDLDAKVRDLLASYYVEAAFSAMAADPLTPCGEDWLASQVLKGEGEGEVEASRIPWEAVESMLEQYGAEPADEEAGGMPAKGWIASVSKDGVYSCKHCRGNVTGTCDKMARERHFLKFPNCSHSLKRAAKLRRKAALSQAAAAGAAAAAATTTGAAAGVAAAVVGNGPPAPVSDDGGSKVDDVMGVGEDPVGEDGMDIDAPAWPPAGVEPAMRA
eukprot:jgi/Tetstr1/430130/TSEL_019963.t1